MRSGPAEVGRSCEKSRNVSQVREETDKSHVVDEQTKTETPRDHKEAHQKRRKEIHWSQTSKTRI